MSIKGFVAGVILTAVSVCGLSASGGIKEEHDVLLESLESIGVRVWFNHSDCRERDIDGLYNSVLRKLVICQDNAKWATDRMIAMTANDYDTLRHEAHHVIQDCVSGELGDGLLGDLFKDPEDYNAFIENALGREKAEAVDRVYTSQGADRLTVLLEMEAFAMASSVPADVISDTLISVCNG